MASKAPYTLQWGMGEVYNISPVISKDAKYIDRHTTFLAACRHMQMPVMIGPPLDGFWNNAVLTNAAPVAGTTFIVVKIPAYTTLIQIHMQLTAIDLPGQGSLARYSYSTDSGATWSDFGHLQATDMSVSDVMAEGAWKSSPVSAFEDTVVAKDPYPIPVTWQAEEQTLWLTFDNVNSQVHAIWAQSVIADGADL